MEPRNQLPSAGSKRRPQEVSPKRETPSPPLSSFKHDKKRQKTSNNDISVASDSAASPTEDNPDCCGQEESNDNVKDRSNLLLTPEYLQLIAEFGGDIRNEGDKLNGIEDLPKHEDNVTIHKLRDGSEVEFKFLRRDKVTSQDWLQTIHLQCTFQGREIGVTVGHCVRRDQIRRQFWTQMKTVSNDVANIAFGIFDRYGRLNDESQGQGLQKGTGIWGSELDLGNLFIIEVTWVDKDSRRKGLGTAMTELLIKESLFNGINPSFILVQSSCISPIIEKEIGEYHRNRTGEIEAINMTTDIPTAFYRSFGFRRVGTSNCFAISVDGLHPSNTVLSKDNFDPERVEADKDFDKETDVLLRTSGVYAIRHKNEAKELERLERLESRMPLYYGAETLPDEECVPFYRQFIHYHGQKRFDFELGKVNNYRENILHIAALQLKLETVRWLLDYADANKRLSSATDVRNRTPLHSLRSFVERRRTVEERGWSRDCVSDNFMGHPVNAIFCIASLSGLPKSVPIDEYFRLKYGCTCGQCISGFLSPRMKCALLYQVESQCNRFVARYNESEEELLASENNFLENIDNEVVTMLHNSKSFMQGLVDLLNLMATIMRADQPPKIANIHKMWKDFGKTLPIIREISQRGFVVESVLRFLIRTARDQDALAGDGTSTKILAEKLNRLPKCRNDHEFGFLELTCLDFAERYNPPGPYT